MSNTDQAPAPAAAAAPAPATAATTTSILDRIKSGFQVLEADVITACQNIEAGLELGVEELTYFLAWLGNHIGEIGSLVTTVQTGITDLNAEGVPIPASLTNGVAAINQAVQGVDDALNDQTVAANPSGALTAGYQAAKSLQIAAASAAAIVATVKAATAPTTTAAAPAS